MQLATKWRVQFSSVRNAGRVLPSLLLAAAIASPVSAQVRISEILANPFGSNVGLQQVELRNFGSLSEDISGWRVSNEFDNLTLPNSLVLDPGATLVLHIASNGTSTISDIYTGSSWASLGVNQGSFALFGPTGGFDDPNAIKDFVEWGAGDQLGESVADAAGIWPAGDFVPVPSEGNSLQLCNRQVTGAGAWLEGHEDTIGGENNCATQAEPSTWGKVKGIYR
jgi:hypothetical protein